MIPFAILSCKIQENMQMTQEVRILDLSEEGFTFRLAEKLVEESVTDRKFLLHFFCFKESRYREVLLESSEEYRLEIEEEQEFYTVYRLKTESEEYRRNAEMLIKEYMRYISLKLDGDDAMLSKELVGYPAEMEEIFAADFVEQKVKWFGKLVCENITEDFPEGFPGEFPGEFELAVSVDNPVWYEKYLKFSLDDFAAEYWKKNMLSAHPLARKKLDCLYIGNQFCHLLFPEEEMLFSILEKAKQEQVKPVVVFTYMQESQIASAEKLLERLTHWCTNNQQKLELVINDWGMLSLLRERKFAGQKLAKERYKCFTLTLGILLQKHRKDVRMQYKQGFQKYGKMFGESSVQAEFYRKYLREYYGITRISYESCGYQVGIAPGKASLHLPFYQMNTSQHCTLYARCHNGDRSRQTVVKNCPEYCRNQVFLYPEMLHMVGRYNSLFGYDERILKDRKVLESYLKQGVDRVVMELL